MYVHVCTCVCVCVLVRSDVKPGNILIQGGYAYLADFNCCKELKNEQDRGNSKTGTLSYMGLSSAVFIVWSLSLLWKREREYEREREIQH
jgi:hypothetical protein